MTPTKHDPRQVEGLTDIQGNVGDIEANVLGQDASRKLVLSFRDVSGISISLFAPELTF